MTLIIPRRAQNNVQTTKSVVYATDQPTDRPTNEASASRRCAGILSNIIFFEMATFLSKCQIVLRCVVVSRFDELFIFSNNYSTKAR